MSWRKCQEVVNPVTVHVKFETPEDLEDAIFDLVSDCKEGAICRGSNEVTKAAERGVAKLIVMAEDINPPELLAHIPMICEEKEIPFGYVRHQEYLGKESGLPEGVKTASIALLEIPKAIQDKYDKVISKIKDANN
ncbi:MAG: 50S ribosomal protein L7ae [Euryarchaeota archaeon]|nr:50S ribosomal protein L7ae [Euryarchaeota archaeon]